MASLCTRNASLLSCHRVQRESRDFGVTWSNLTVIIPPVPGAANECANDDGAAFYDADTDTWHYLGQCMSRKQVWNMCHFTRQGADPVGPFTPDPGNPVVRSGQLWGSICGPGRNCPAGMGEEGTPDIVSKSPDGLFFVTFHGWDPAATKSARGVAATKDWTTWYTSGYGLPTGAIFTDADCHRWSVPGGWANGTCVGGGEGSILVVSWLVRAAPEGHSPSHPVVPHFLVCLSRAPTATCTN